MSKELNDFRDKNDKRPTGLIMHFRECLLTNGSKIPAQLYQTTDLLIRFLPRPADYLFLYFLGFYFLMLSLKVEYRLAVLVLCHLAYQLI